MDAVAELVEIEALKRLKARYFYYVDTKDWDAWLDLFTPDATFQWDDAVSTMGRDGKPGQKFVGREALSSIHQVLKTARTVHIGHSPILEVLSETEARGIWAMEDIVEFPDQGFHGYGHYHETYLKTEGGWRIRTSHLHRLRITTTLR